MPKKEVKQLKQIIYSSRPLGFDKDTVKQILVSSSKNNPRVEVTGLLIYSEDLYLQLLEGPTPALEETFSKIKSDRRHHNIIVLKEDFTDCRLFASWTMRPQPLNVLMFDEDDIKNGLIERFSPSQAFNVFNNLSIEFDQFDYTDQ